MDLSPIAQQSQTASSQNLASSESESSNTAGQVSANATSEQSEDFDTFLTLLTAQIRNQDPLEPVDSTQFVEQLATFSNVELQAENNQILEGISDMLEQFIAVSGTGAPVSEPNPEDLI